LYCNIQGLSLEQLKRITVYHFCLKDKLKAAEEEHYLADAKVKRLYK
jgi:hypothetical protein